MSTDKEGIYKELSYEIIGALYEVHNELGSVHKENIYSRAIAIELKAGNISFSQEKSIAVKYKGNKIGIYKPDFIIDNKIVLEVKAVPAITKLMFDQIFYYIKGTGYKLVLLVNFGTHKLTIKRRIYT